MQYFTGNQDGTNVIQDSFSFKLAKRYISMNILEIIEQLAGSVTVTDTIICLAGLLLLGIWLLRTSFGRNALADSVPRRNNMPLYLPFIPLFIWFGAVSIAISITKKFLDELPDWQIAFVDNLILCIATIAAMAVTIFLARGCFDQRLKGFGLNAKAIHKDFFAAFVNLLSIWPVLTLMAILTIFFGKLLWDQDFHLQQHQQLELITAHPQLPVRVLIIVTAVVVVPVFEEMLFRGLFQTMIRSFTGKPWLSIAISSGLFATVHANIGHWPTLFMLAACLGYSYEKSGSLFRPIFIHSLFNAISITFVLCAAG